MQETNKGVVGDRAFLVYIPYYSGLIFEPYECIIYSKQKINEDFFFMYIAKYIAFFHRIIRFQILLRKFCFFL